MNYSAKNVTNCLQLGKSSRPGRGRDGEPKKAPIAERLSGKRFMKINYKPQEDDLELAN
jgi:hypothetical protein